MRERGRPIITHACPLKRANSVDGHIRDGKRMITDGPFAKTKEQIGGFFLLKAGVIRTLDRSMVGAWPRRAGRKEPLATRG